jgi:hypothetical protein
VLPPKIGDGVFGSSVGAVQAFGAYFFGAAAASSALTTKERLAGRAQTLARALLSLALTVRACIFLRLVIDDDTMYKVRGNANGAWREGEGPDRGGDLASTSASPGGSATTLAKVRYQLYTVGLDTDGCMVSCNH